MWVQLPPSAPFPLSSQPVYHPKKPFLTPILASPFAFADQQGLESVAGSTHRAEIKEEVGVQYPKSGDKRREVFEDTLRKLGMWDRTSGLDHNKLKSLWLTPSALSPEARARLETFLTESREFKARLKKGGTSESRG